MANVLTDGEVITLTLVAEEAGMLLSLLGVSEFSNPDDEALAEDLYAELEMVTGEIFDTTTPFVLTRTSAHPEVSNQSEKD